MLTNDGSRIPQTGSIYPKVCVWGGGGRILFFGHFPENSKKILKSGRMAGGWGWRFPESVNAKVLLISGESFQHRIQRPGRGSRNIKSMWPLMAAIFL